MSVFKKGDSVKWTSQSGSYSKKKEGEVIEIVKAGQNPLSKSSSHCGWGGARKHDSFVIKVGTKNYWPLVSYLKASK